jgi:hypothetical protein
MNPTIQLTTEQRADVFELLRTVAVEEQLEGLAQKLIDKEPLDFYDVQEALSALISGFRLTSSVKKARRYRDLRELLEAWSMANRPRAHSPHPPTKPRAARSSSG